jgi:hypothetical protein
MAEIEPAPGPVGVDRLIIDTVMPSSDAAIAEHLVVHADPETTFRAARGLDFLTVRTPLLVAAMWVRGIPDRLRHHGPGAPPPRLVLGEGAGLPGWLVLGEEPGREIAFGAVGKFWQPSIDWLDVPAEEFASFAEPGYGKIAANFSVRPYGEHATLLTYECRTTTTDPDSRRRFARYWRLVRPFVAHIMRATLRTIRADAER